VTDWDSPIGVQVIVTMRTEDLPAEDRFEWWFEQVSKDTAPTVVSSPHAGDFRAALTLADLGPVRLTVLTYPEGIARCRPGEGTDAALSQGQ
jgi:hypothetical protein